MCALQASVLECPQCGAAISITERSCSYCFADVYVKKTKSLESKAADKYIKAYKKLLQDNDNESVELYTALGICHLKKKNYKEANIALDKAINLLPEDGNPYYYKALALLQGKRPRLQTLGHIKNVVHNIEAAVDYEEIGKYYYLMYLIQIDFYDAKRLKNGKTATELNQQAIACEIDDEEILEIKAMIGL